MALFKRKRQYQNVDLGNSDPPSLSSSSDYPPSKRMRYDESNATFSRDEFDDGLGPDLIGDDHDRQYLNSLPELERENILMERHERRQDLQRRLARLTREGRIRDSTDSPATTAPYQQSQQHAAPVQNHALPDSIGSYGTRNSSLNDLRQRRMQQKTKRKQQESDVQAQRREQETQESQPVQKEKQHKQLYVPTFQDILHITLSRTAIEAWVAEDFFKDVVKDCYVKYLVGTHNNAKVYKLVEIADLEDCEPYSLGSSGTKCPYRMRVALGDHEEVTTMDKISNQPVTHQEFEFWLNTNYNSQNPEAHLPTADRIFKKVKKLKAIQEDHHDAIQRVRQLNRKYTMDDSMHTLSKAAAELKIDLAQIDADAPNKEKKQSQLSEVESLIEEKKKLMNSSSSRVRKINEKIIQRNHEQRSQARLIQRKKAMDEDKRRDPFSRIESHRATSSMFGRATPDDGKQSAEEKQEEEKKKKLDAKDIASAHDFDLDIQI